jgi:FKBP-type peptidyl-prolyl cis-trans isomerase
MIKKVKFCALVMLLCGINFCSHAQQELSKNDLINYSWAADTARDSAERHVLLDVNAYMAGVKDAQEGYKPLLNDDESEPYFIQQLQSIKTYRRSQKEKLSLAIQETDKFIMRSAKTTNGMRMTAAELMYVELKSGIGSSPAFQDAVKITYIIKNTKNDIVYDSKQQFIQKPVDLYLLSIGMGEALQHMKRGSVWRLFLTSDWLVMPGSLRTQLPPFVDPTIGGVTMDLTLVDFLSNTSSKGK